MTISLEEVELFKIMCSRICCTFVHSRHESRISTWPHSSYLCGRIPSGFRHNFRDVWRQTRQMVVCEGRNTRLENRQSFNLWRRKWSSNAKHVVCGFRTRKLYLKNPNYTWFFRSSFLKYQLAINGQWWIGNVFFFSFFFYRILHFLSNPTKVNPHWPQVNGSLEMWTCSWEF